MLKPAADSTPDGDRSFGKLANQLVDDAKSYARAEVDYAKAVAADKAKGIGTGAGLLVAASFVAMAGLNALCIAILASLAYHMGTLLAGIVTFLLVGAIAAVIGWFGWVKVRDSL